jgi:hypothetical protein
VGRHGVRTNGVPDQHGPYRRWLLPRPPDGTRTRPAGTADPPTGTLVAVSIDPGRLGAEPHGDWPRTSRVATAALVVGILAIPFGLLVYPGLLLGVVAVGLGLAGLVITRGDRAHGRGRAGVGVVAGLVGLTIAASLGWQGLRTIRGCEDRLGHRPDHSEIQTCIRDGL